MRRLARGVSSERVMNRQLLLVRHPPVAATFQGICYGTTDVPLDTAGLTSITAIVDELLSHGPIDRVIHSDLLRCAVVGDHLARIIKVPIVADTRLRERCFGSWESRTWDDIYAETGDAMLGMTQDPQGWRPPGGETTFELRDRVLACYHDLPPTGRIVLITHGGPIAALRGTLGGRPVSDWPGLVPTCGQIVSLS